MKSNPPVNKESAVYRMVCEEDTTVPEKIETEESLKSQSNTQEVQSRSFKVLQKALDNGEGMIIKNSTTGHSPFCFIEPNKINGLTLVRFWFNFIGHTDLELPWFLIFNYCNSFHRHNWCEGCPNMVTNMKIIIIITLVIIFKLK